MKYLQIRVISDQYEKEIKSRKENSQLGSRQPLASVGDQAFSFQLRPYISQTYILTVYNIACYIFT